MGSLTSIVLGIVGFLLAWAGKHLLDRLLLPRVLDWWARKNKKWAMERATQLLKQLEMEARCALDTRHLILFLEDRTAAMVIFLGVFNALAIITIIFPVEPEFAHVKRGNRPHLATGSGYRRFDDLRCQVCKPAIRVVVYRPKHALARNHCSTKSPPPGCRFK
jgi:hypothetical protein